MAKTTNHGRVPSQRQLRVAELIRRTLSDILARGDIHDPDLVGISVTVGEVTMSTDLKVATAYVLPLGGGDREAMLAALRANRYELRRAINKALTLKYSPEFRFQIDKTFDRLDLARDLFDRDDVRRDLDQD